ncbi:MAG TPA: hypothetical protein VK204_17280 [Nocardioidaceae bacterium]|nr:hypothetical protein [Nocardioidaceae bacterium]
MSRLEAPTWVQEMPDRIDVTIVLYAVLSLTIVRMVPVALALLGARLDRASVLFVGGFAHGLTAGPLTTRYGRAAAARGPVPGSPVPDVPVRGLPRRMDAAEPQAVGKLDP